MKHVAFVFDMDGVIVDSNPFHKVALQQFCGRHGLELTEEQLRDKVYGRTNRDWIPNVFGEINESLVKRFADEKEALFRAVYDPHIRLIDGLATFLQWLKANDLPTAIATSAPRANVDFTLSKTGTAEYFPVILDESFVTRGKPDPEIYIRAAKALNLPPNQCLVFEDSLSGIKSAKSAGCAVVGITTTHSAQELDGVDLIIDDFRGLNPVDLACRLIRN